MSLLALDRRLDRGHAVQVLLQGMAMCPVEGKCELTTSSWLLLNLVARVIVNSAPSARWHTFCPTDEESIDQMER